MNLLPCFTYLVAAGLFGHCPLIWQMYRDVKHNRKWRKVTHFRMQSDHIKCIHSRERWCIIIIFKTWRLLSLGGIVTGWVIFCCVACTTFYSLQVDKIILPKKSPNHNLLTKFRDLMKIPHSMTAFLLCAAFPSPSVSVQCVLCNMICRACIGLLTFLFIGQSSFHLQFLIVLIITKYEYGRS